MTMLQEDIMFHGYVIFSLPALRTGTHYCRTTRSYNGRKPSAICSSRSSYGSRAEAYSPTAAVNSAVKMARTAASIALQSNSFAQGV